MSDIMSTMLHVPRRVSLAIAAPAHLLAVKIYLIAAIAGADLYAPAGTIRSTDTQTFQRRSGLIVPSVVAIDARR